MRHAFLVSILFITVLLAGCVNDLPDLPDEVPDRQTSLEVVTETGATVYLDDTMRGTVNSSGSLVITSVQPGSHDLRVEHPDYFPKTRAVSLREFRRNTETVELLSQDGTARDLTISLFYYAGSGSNAYPVARIEGPGGVYTCESGEFSESDEIVTLVDSPYEPDMNAVYGWQTRCLVGPIPYGNYTATVSGNGYVDIERDIFVNTTRAYEHFWLGDGARNFASSAPEGTCSMVRPFGYSCESVQVSRLGTYTIGSDDNEFYLLNATVTSRNEDTFRFLRPILSIESYSNGAYQMVSEEIAQGDTRSFLFVTSIPSEYREEVEDAESLAVRLRAENQDQRYNIRHATIGFKPIITDLSNVSIDRCERRIGDVTIEGFYSTLGDCLRSYSYGSVHFTAVREFCEDRPAYVGNIELIAGDLVLYERLVCADLPSTVATGSCYIDQGPISFSCEEVDSDLLENTGVQTIDVTIANRMASDVFVRNVSLEVQRSDPWRYEHCTDVVVNRFLVQGERDSLSFDFDSCATEEDRYPNYRATYDIEAEGEQQSVSHVFNLPNR